MNWLEKKLLEMEIKNMLGKISWRTTTWGVLGILAALASAVYQFHLTGHFDLDGTLKSVMTIAAGCGLIAAADNKNLPGAKIVVLFLCLALAAPGHAQTATPNFYAAGVSFNNSATPAIAGTGLYARTLSDSSGTYAIAVVDVLPNTLKPFTVTTIMSPGVAQRVTSFGSVAIYSLTSAGLSYNGSNTGWGWTAGGAAAIPIGKTKWRVFPNVRVAKSSVSNGTGYQLTIGTLFGRAF